MDMRIWQFGNKRIIDIVSLKAVEEFISLIPSKIDRDPQKDFPAGKLSDDSFLTHCSDESWAERRAQVARKLSLNTSSQHLPIVVEV